MDPFSVTAGVVGIAAPAVRCIHMLLRDLQKIVDAPETLKSLKEDLLSVDQALTSLQAISDLQWKSLGETVVMQSKAATTTCKESCDRFRTALSRWTRHSEDGKLSLRDRAMVGFFKQGYVKSMSEQLQQCKLTLTSVVCIAILHSSLQQTPVTEDMRTMISKTEAEIADFITATDKQLAEVNAKLGSLCLAKQEQDETEADRASAISQVTIEQTLLGESRKLLEELLSGIYTATVNARKDQAQVINNFGNQGLQAGQSYAPIHPESNLPSERPETPPAPFATIPFSRDPDFVNREDILEQIDQRCSEPAARVALVGLGGVGKSQLAIEYAYQIAARQSDTWVFWVHAGTQARVEEGFRTIADAVKLPGLNQPKANILQLVYSWLSNERNGRWIIILDSADDRDVFYSPTSGDDPTSGSGPTGGDAGNGRPFAAYLPQSRNGSVIITTRNKDLAFRITGRRRNMIEVGPMAPTDALTLLEKKLGPLPDLDVAADLVEVLDLVPLAISQVAAYIQARAPLSSLEKYLAEFREGERKRSRLLEHDAGDLRRDGGASNAILTTWQISFDHIRSQRRSAADLLSLMSFFDRQGIPMWVLRPSRIAKDAMRAKGLDKASRSTPKWKSKSSIPWLQAKVKKLLHDITTGRLRRKRNAGDGESDDSSSSSATDADTDDGADDDVDSGFEDDVAMLRDYCLIATNEAGDEFEMHALVQLSTRRWLEAFGQQETFKQQCIERIAAFFPTGEYEDWATCRSLFAHVQVAVGYQPSEDMVETWATLLYNGGRYARLQGKYEVAQQMLGKVRKVREKKLGKEDVATLASISSLAIVLLDRGCWEESEELFRQVMETYMTKFGADHLDTLTSMGNLALIYSRQGRWEEAEKLEVQVMETSKRKLGPDHLDTLTCMNNLASTLWHQGRWEEAEKLQLQAMETRKTKLGADHPSTLTSIDDLASTYAEQGRWEEAEELEVQVLETRKTKLGADHPSTLTTMSNLALTLWNQGWWEEAEKLQVQVMETRKTKLGANHPDTLTSMANLASTYKGQGRVKEAEELELQVMEACKTKLGANHVDTLTSMGNLASTYWKQGRWKEAEELGVQVLEMSKTKLGADHPLTLTRMANLAFTWKEQGRHIDALELMEDCAEVQQRVFGAKHLYTLSCLAAIAEWSS